MLFFYFFFFLVIKPRLNILCKQLLYLAWAKFRFSLLIVCFSQLLTFSTRSLSILLNFCAKQKRHKNIKTKIKITNLFSSIFLELFRLREFCICVRLGELNKHNSNAICFVFDSGFLLPNSCVCPCLAKGKQFVLAIWILKQCPDIGFVWLANEKMRNLRQCD